MTFCWRSIQGYSKKYDIVNEIVNKYWTWSEDTLQTWMIQATSKWTQSCKTKKDVICYKYILPNQTDRWAIETDRDRWAIETDRQMRDRGTDRWETARQRTCWDEWSVMVWEIRESHLQSHSVTLCPRSGVRQEKLDEKQDRSSSRQWQHTCQMRCWSVTVNSDTYFQQNKNHTVNHFRLK